MSLVARELIVRRKVAERALLIGGGCRLPEAAPERRLGLGHVSLGGEGLAKVHLQGRVLGPGFDRRAEEARRGGGIAPRNGDAPADARELVLGDELSRFRDWRFGL